MIENEHQIQAARSWLRYWKSTAADGEQSWMGGEEARAEVALYARMIAGYESSDTSWRVDNEIDAPVIERGSDDGLRGAQTSETVSCLPVTGVADRASIDPRG